ncbi:MAG: ion transporter [Chitinophagales bacterium]
MLQRIFLSEKIILSAIFFNAMLIFALSFPSLTHDPILSSIDHLFILFFIVEAVVKLTALGQEIYFKSNWNKFDFLVVLVSIPALLPAFMQLPNLSILLLLRILRIFRLVRFLHFIPNMRQLLVGLGRAFRASIFVLIALCGLVFILSIFTCQLYHDIAPEYFGDPLISAYTTFQLFTVEGWNEIPIVLAESGRLSDVEIGFTRFYFVLVVLIGGIFGMSLANAVFVDEMTIDNNIELEKKMDELHKKIDALIQAQNASDK